MNDETAKLLRESPFESIKSAIRLVEWYESPGQIVSDWDSRRYALAKAILAASEPNDDSK